MHIKRRRKSITVSEYSENSELISMNGTKLLKGEIHANASGNTYFNKYH